MIEGRNIGHTCLYLPLDQSNRFRLVYIISHFLPFPSFCITCFFYYLSFLSCLQSPVLERVVRCLDLQEVPSDPYSLSLMMYAYSVYEPANSRRADCLQVLYSKATLRGENNRCLKGLNPLCDGTDIMVEKKINRFFLVE